MVARVPDHDEWDWRVSIADVVHDGPFSMLPGVDRVIAVVEGEGMVLTVDGIEHRVLASTGAVAFDGSATTSCRLLAGPVRDLNLMVRRGRASGSMEVIDVVTSVAVDGSAVWVVVAGEVTFAGELLVPGDAVIDDVGELHPIGPARVARIRVGPTPA